MPDVVAIIQARMASTRLPGKVLMPMAGVPMLKRVIDRVRKAESVRDIIVAMPASVDNNELKRHCNDWCVASYIHQGDPDDVLSRFVGVMEHWAVPATIVRVCGDSPLIRPDLIDAAVEAIHASDPGYVGFTVGATNLPAIESGGGECPEVFTDRALKLADLVALTPAQREHVTPVMRVGQSADVLFHPQMFQGPEVRRLSVDTQEDFDRVEQLIKELEAVPA